MTVGELRAITDRLLSYLEETGRERFELSEDFYWVVPVEVVYDLNKDPESLEVGQLFDDWSRLKEILKDEEPPIGYGLVWLSSVLRFIGEKNVY